MHEWFKWADLRISWVVVLQVQLACFLSTTFTTTNANFPIETLSTVSSSQSTRHQSQEASFSFFGLPFIGIIVGGSFALSQITQTRFDHRDMRHSKVCYIVTCFCMMFIPFILSGCERRSIGNGQE